MLRKMKAGIWYGPQDIRLEEIDVPQVGPGQVLVDTEASGICGSDLHVYFGEWEQPKAKVATGHELSGVVVEVGEDVSGVTVGIVLTARPDCTIYATTFDTRAE